MENAKATTATARWGSACSPCSVAKAKCIRSNQTPGAKCDRCQNLDKDCLKQTPKPRKKRQSKPSRTAQLEERLNSLIDVLKAQGEIPRNHATLSGKLEDTANYQTPSSIGESNTTSAFKPHGDVLNFLPPTYNVFAPPTCLGRAPVNEEDLHPKESDDELLSIYVNQLCLWFPFVPIPPGTTPAQLEKTRPFLLQVIRMVSSVRDLRSMWGQKFLIAQRICESVVMRAERSLDFLQGILVLLGFYHYHCLLHTQFASLVQLATGLISDMGLNRSPRSTDNKKLPPRAMEHFRPRTNDERRALIGVWYISSSAALTFHKLDSARYTAYIDQCLIELAEGAEYKSDSLLIYMARIQYLTERIFNINSSRQHTSDNFPGVPKIPITIYHSASRQELENLEVSIPSDLKLNYLLMSHLLTAKLRLYDSMMIESNILDSLSLSFSSLSLSEQSKSGLLHHSNAILQSWFSNWLAIPASDYFYISQPLYGQLIYAVTVISRWSKFTHVKAPDNSFPSNGSCSTSRPRPIDQIRLVSNGLQDSSTAPDISTGENTAQLDLPIDMGGILDALETRLENAAKEISRIQGKTWKNEAMNVAARKIKIARSRLEKWSEVISMVGGEGILLLRKYGILDEDEAIDSSSRAEERPEGLEELLTDRYLDSWQWGYGLFEEMDIDQGLFFDGQGDFSPSFTL
ncbi:hypothetical protein F5884DRAFT_829255 [Xylogone sp. PMI_703]|nr:hypothetical protein F5884DRAFT_829255 [Xylogone sp. PMI_703]